MYGSYINEMMLDLINVLTNMLFILNVYNDNNKKLLDVSQIKPPSP